MFQSLETECPLLCVQVLRVRLRGGADELQEAARGGAATEAAERAGATPQPSDGACPALQSHFGGHTVSACHG